MTVKIAPDARRQFLNASGVPYSGAKLFYYAAGTSTKQDTYTSSTGLVANSNPIILDSAGRTPYGVWMSSGIAYKEILAPSTDTDPPGSPIYTEDNISGINDTVAVTGAQWLSSALTPTYISTTSFTVPGDQVSELNVGRRLQLTVAAGTVYGYIVTSVFGAVTTVTLVMDAGQTLDVGLTSFNKSILSGTNYAVPKLADAGWTNLGVAALAASNTFTGGTNTFSNIVTFSGTIAGATPLVFEGATANAFETSFVITDPTADRTVTFPDKDIDFTTALVPAGTLIHFAGVAANVPTGYLVCPLTLTNISRTTYAALFTAIGTQWGVGDGSTTFALPWFAEGHAMLQANANVATASVGEVIAHIHTMQLPTTNTAAGAGGGSPVSTITAVDTSSTGGTANLAAGVKVLMCIKY